MAGSRGARNQQVARAGEYFVVAELNKRGAFAVPFAGNMPRIDIIACNSEECRTIHIQVKTKRGGKNWHSSIVGSQPTAPKDDEHNFWVFVDLGDVQTSPRYWIVPEWWIRDDIYQAHQAYLKSTVEYVLEIQIQRITRLMRADLSNGKTAGIFLVSLIE